MKPSILIALLILAAAPQARGQRCDLPDITTDPDNPNAVNTFDWRLDNIGGNQEFLNDGQVWLYTVPNSPPVQWPYIPNPFSSGTNQSNVNSLSSFDPANPALDYEPEDGWELLAKRLGSPDPTAVPIATNPFIILYNKYRGLLRVLVYVVGEDEEFNTATLSLAWRGGNPGELGLGNALFAHAGHSSKALDAFNSDGQQQKLSAANTYNNSQTAGGQWLMAEMPIAYDPCVCHFESLWNIDVHLGTSGDIVELGIQNTKGDWLSKEEARANTSLVGIYQGLINSAGKTAGSVEAFVNRAGMSLGVGPLVHAPDSSAQGSIREAKSGLSGPLPEFMKAAIPHAGLVLGIANYLVAGGTQKASDTKTVVFNLPQKASGSINTEFLQIRNQVRVPGAAATNGGNFPYAPTYDVPIGVFNILRTPKVSYQDYLIHLAFNGDPASPPGAVSYQFRHYRLDSPQIEYLLNPYAGLVLRDISAALLYKADDDGQGSDSQPIHVPIDDARLEPVMLGADIEAHDRAAYAEKLYQAGYFIDYALQADTTAAINVADLRYRTRYVSPDMLHKYGILVYDGPNQLHQPALAIKIMARFDRADDPAADPVIALFTYELPPPQSSASPIYLSSDLGFLPNLAAGEWPSPQYAAEAAGIPMWDEYPNTLTISNTPDSPAYFFAWEAVHIASGVSIPSGVSVESAGHIDMAEGSALAGGELNIAAQPRNYGSGFLAPDAAALSAFCQDRHYYDPYFTREAEPAPYVPPFFHFAAFPNPSTGVFNARLRLPEASTIQLDLYDVTGRLIRSVVPMTRIDPGQHYIPHDISDLPPAVYILRLIADGAQQSLKIVKQ